jgi:hypothetical protein
LIPLRVQAYRGDTTHAIFEEAPPFVLKTYFDELRELGLKSHFRRDRIIGHGDTQRVSEATLEALHEPECSREKDEDEEGKELSTSTPSPWRGLETLSYNRLARSGILQI